MSLVTFVKNNFVWRASEWEDCGGYAKSWRFYCQHFACASYYLHYIRWESDISSFATKRRNRRVIKCHVNNKVTHTCFQLVKTGKEQFQMKVSRQALTACVSLALFSLVSVGVLSTRVNTESASDPANYALFPDRRSYFHRSLHNHLIHGDHCESDKFTLTSKIYIYVYHYAIDIDFFYINIVWTTVYKNSFLSFPLWM